MTDAGAQAGHDAAAAALAELQRRFVAQLPSRLGSIETLFGQLSPQRWNPADAEALHRVVHSLSGTAGIFGMPTLSDAARLAEQPLTELVRGPGAGGVPSESAWQHVGEGLRRLVTLARTLLGQVTPDITPVEAPLGSDARPCILLVETDAAQADRLRQGLSDAGYRVRVLSDVAGLREALAAPGAVPPAAVVLDTVFPENDPVGAALVQELRLGLHGRIPVVLALADDNLPVRLAASRAGISRTLTRPLDAGRLANLLDALTGRQPVQPYRVLLVDDDPLLLQAQASVLRAAGMEVHSLSQPLQTLHELDRFKPDVLLLDVYMPDASGPELAAALRERDAYLHLPVLFLSAETDPTQQLLALNLGGDDFLVKPVRPDHLVAAVSARARRARQNSALRERLQTTLYEREREHLALDHHAIVSIADRRGTLIYANDLFCQVSGYSREELLGQHCRILRTHQQPGGFARDIWREVTSGRVWHGEICCQRKCGSPYWVKTTITPFLNAEGVPYQYIVIQTDISHMKAAEAVLRASESRLNFLVSSSPVAIYTRKATAPYAAVYVSPNVTQLMGLRPEDLTGDGQLGASQVHPEDRARVAAELPCVVELGSHLSEYRLRRGDGSYRWVHDQRRLVRDAAGEPVEIIGYWLDITERKNVEHELSLLNQELEQRVAQQTQTVIESERFARATLDALSARVVILDGQGVVLAANRAWTEFGDPALVREGANYLASCDDACGTLSGDCRPVATGIRAVIRGDQKEFLHEYSVRQEADQHWFLCRVERFPGEGEVRVVVSHENITQMKLIERQHLRSQRLESLGTLAGGVAHDLNNALAPVLMGMGMLKEQYPEEARLFEMIQGSAQRGANMVRQLLTFAKGAEGERASLSPERMLRELESLMNGSFPKNIRLVVECAPDLPTVSGDATQLHQVLLNLCVNSRDAMPEGGTLTLTAAPVELDAAYARSIADARPGRYVALRVRDTGEGIPHELLDRIFDPFFTTKSPDKGTGLGLSTVLGIVKSHAGFVQVYSQPGQGTTFVVYLPAEEVRSGEAAVPVAPSEFRGQGETVLFVDDEAAVREVGRAVLERLNFHVVTATDGADGLLQVAQHRAHLRAIVTDLHMPRMDGLAFVRALRPMLPEVAVVVASGRMDEAMADEFRRLGVMRRLDKPYTEALLIRELNLLLAPAPASGAGSPGQ